MSESSLHNGKIPNVSFPLGMRDYSKKASISTFIVVLFILGAFTLSSFGAIPFASAIGSSLNLSTSSGPSGTIVTVTGSGYNPADTYVLCINTFQSSCTIPLSGYTPPFFFVGSLVTFTPEASGNVPPGITITIPSEEPNSASTYSPSYYINSYISGSPATTVSSTPFTVTTSTLVLTPNKGPSGLTVDVSGTGYAANQNYELCFNNFAPALYCTAPFPETAFGIRSITSSASGSISASFNFTSAPAGNNTIGIYYPVPSNDNFYMTSLNFTSTNDQLTLVASPSSAVPGSGILITGTNYAPDVSGPANQPGLYYACVAPSGSTQSYQCYGNTPTTTDITTDGNGNLIGCITLPALATWTEEIGVFYKENYSNYYPFIVTTPFNIISGTVGPSCSSLTTTSTTTITTTLTSSSTITQTASTTTTQNSVTTLTKAPSTATTTNTVTSLTTATSTIPTIVTSSTCYDPTVTSTVTTVVPSLTTTTETQTIITTSTNIVTITGTSTHTATVTTEVPATTTQTVLSSTTECGTVITTASTTPSPSTTSSTTPSGVPQFPLGGLVTILLIAAMLPLILLFRVRRGIGFTRNRMKQ